MNNTPIIVQINSGVIIKPNRYFENGVYGTMSRN